MGSSPFRGVCAGKPLALLALHLSAREGCPGHCDTLTGGTLYTPDGSKKLPMALRCGVLDEDWGIAPLNEELALHFMPHSPRFFYTSVGSTFGFSVSERCAFGNWAEGCNMPKRYDSSFCGEQLTRRGELLGFLQAGLVASQCKCAWIATCSLRCNWNTTYSHWQSQFYLATVRRNKVLAHLFHQRSSSVCLHQHSQVCYVFIALTLVIANFMLPKSKNSKICKCGFLLPFSSAVTISDLDRLIDEGVTLCGHACFNTTCSLATVLKGGADC